MFKSRENKADDKVILADDFARSTPGCEMVTIKLLRNYGRNFTKIGNLHTDDTVQHTSLH